MREIASRAHIAARLIVIIAYKYYHMNIEYDNKLFKLLNYNCCVKLI